MYTTTVQLGPGEQASVQMSLAGHVDPDHYQLVVRPQPLVVPERYRIQIASSAGGVQAGLVGTLARPGVLDASGLSVVQAR